ncbi:MAG: dihydrodipicolinate synthase family protein, partial [Gammaproteobacteria bacterium]|nr:dihydrodipicolinate synthase family protein [Gammaproteobacteria bacterium]
MTAEIRGSIVALVTPMLENGQVDTTAYEHLLQYHLERGTQGFVIGGTTGESATLTPIELGHLVRSAVRIVDGKVPIIAGSGNNSTAASVELTRLVCSAGAQACLVVTPYYNKPTQEGLYRHY